MPEKVSLDDERLVPLFQAMNRVDRASMGFSEISDDAVVYLEGQDDKYDVMLHTNEGLRSRTIAFRLIGEQYEWVGEQLTYWGPNTFKTIDGTIRENITITYKVGDTSIYDETVGHLDIDYSGEDQSLASKPELELKDIESVIAEWAKQTW